MISAQVASANPLAPGLRLGRYELIQRLAVGGMAEIYLARATGIQGFEKLVVLKRILPQFATNTDFVSMFLDEARLSATLQHPNIAQVHDIGEYNGSFFFTMEYVRGQDVRSLLKTTLLNKKRIPFSHTLTIIIGAAAGLHAAHEKCDLDGTPLNVVHRDVSPSNVLVSYDGAVKLVDFGVAKAAQRQTQTAAGTLKGKVAYMSPEQCRGDDLDRRSDIFALGILLYELSCQKRLFGGGTEFEIMTRIVHEDVAPPSEKFNSYPAELEAILMKALRRNPDDRYDTAQDMQLALEEFARKARLPVSTVKLGAFMKETFVESMRAQQEAISSRPRTEEIVPDAASDDQSERRAMAAAAAAALPAEDEYEIEIDLSETCSGADIPRPGQARREPDSPSALCAMPGSPGSAPRLTPAVAASSPSIQYVHPRSGRLWQLIAVASLAAAAAMLFMQTRGADPEPSPAPSVSRTHEASPRVTPASSTPVAPARAAAETTSAQPRPVAEPVAAAPPVQATTATPAVPAVTVDNDTEAKPASAPVAKRVVKKRTSKPRRRARARRRAKPKKRAPMNRAVARQPAKKKGWGLDSPMPPPR